MSLKFEFQLVFSWLQNMMVRLKNLGVGVSEGWVCLEGGCI